MKTSGYFVHESSFVDSGVSIGNETQIWHFTHVLTGAVIGEKCSLGQNVSVAGEAVIGKRVKIQNNVSIYDGVTIEDDVFLGPSCVLTNVTNPRSQVSRKHLYEKTLIKKGATIGANATILCGVTIGRYSFIAAGAVVTKDVGDYILVKGVPAEPVGWISRHGHLLTRKNKEGVYLCPESGLRYKEIEPNRLVCLDMDEDEPLSEGMSKGEKSYRDYKK